MKILYVQEEDNEITKIKKLFKQKGVDIDNEKNIEKAIELILVNKYDVVIIDIDNRSVESLDMCEKVRSKNIILPIIFISNKSNYKFLLNSLKVGGDDFIKKPFDFEELYLRIQSILRRPKQYIGNFKKINSFTFDLQNKRLYYKDLFINLTKREVSLLDFFMRNEGILLPRADILENVWDMNANPFTNIVEVYISSIKNKVKECTDEELIKNVPGIGYYIGNIDRIKKINFLEKSYKYR